MATLSHRIVFAVSLNAKESALTFLGLAFVFTSVGLNLLFDAFRAPQVWKSGIVQGIVMVGCAMFCYTSPTTATIGATYLTSCSPASQTNDLWTTQIHNSDGTPLAGSFV
jgi:hypothetical protein